MLKKYWANSWPYLIILVFSGLLLVPQVVNQATIVGSDALFHYNRFYETAMQLKTGQFDYFISLFGYHQSGRIVNALYGPLFAYLQGGLVLLSGTWFRYQLLSRLLLSLIAGTGLYKLLRQSRVSQILALPLVLLFLTTFAVQYWSIRQGFSSWGVAFFPWCLLPVLEVTQTKQVSPLALGLAVAVMLQVHTLSTLLLCLTYLPFFLYAFLTTHDKRGLVKQVGLAIALCLVLTANVWLPLISLGQANDLIQPFVNKNLPQHTIDRSSSVLLFQPKALVLVLLAQGLLMVLPLKGRSPLYWLSSLSLLILLFFSSSLFPWDNLAGQDLKLVDLIQFPFRFFLIATVLLFWTAGQSLEKLTAYHKPLAVLLAIMALSGAGEVMMEHQTTIASQYQTNFPIQQKKHTELLGSADQVRESLHSTDLEDFLTLAIKGTPDYLPLYHETTENKYTLTADLLYKPHQAVTKTVENGALTLRWTATSTDQISLPIVVYTDSQLTLNGQKLPMSARDLSPIGTPIVTPQLGDNTLTLSYHPKPYLYPAIYLSLTSWVLLGAYLVIQKKQAE